MISEYPKISVKNLIKRGDREKYPNWLLSLKIFSFVGLYKWVQSLLFRAKISVLYFFHLKNIFDNDGGIFFHSKPQKKFTIFCHRRMLKDRSVVEHKIWTFYWWLEVCNKKVRTGFHLFTRRIVCDVVVKYSSFFDDHCHTLFWKEKERKITDFKISSVFLCMCVCK